MKDADKTKEQLISELVKERKKYAELKMETSVCKKLNTQMVNTEEKYKRIFENIQDVYYEITFDGILLEISPSIERLTKYKPSEMIGKSVYDFLVDPEERKQYLNIIHKAGRVDDFEITVIDKDGQLVTLSACAKIVFDQQSGIHKITSSLRDITERKRAERGLRESEIWYRTLFETTTAATAIVEEDTTISLINTAYEKLSGYSKEEIEGKKSFTEFVSKDDLKKVGKYHMLRRMEHDTAPRNYEFKFVNRDGEVKTIYMTAGAILGTKKSVASLLDISERKEAEKLLKKKGHELKLKSHKLEELNTALKVLLKRVEEDKATLEDNVLANVKNIILPHIEQLKKVVRDRGKGHVSALESSLTEIISPFSKKLSAQYLNFTAKEILISSFIKEGKTTKEIAEILHISPGTVNFHRNNIRKKLHLKNKDTNLQSYLCSLS
jgi:PAS domain S-box-containing protein